MTADKHFAFDLIRWRVHKRRYSSIRSIMAETGESDTALKIGLAHLHDIHFDFKDDPFIFFTEDSGQRELLAKDGIPAPTWLQILLTSKIYDLDEQKCKDRFQALMKEDQP